MKKNNHRQQLPVNPRVRCAVYTRKSTEEGRGRHTRPLAQQRQRMLEAPIRDLESRIDEHNFGHDALRVSRGAPPRSSSKIIGPFYRGQNE